MKYLFILLSSSLFFVCCSKSNDTVTTPPTLFFSDDFNRTDLGDNWNVVKDTGDFVKMENGELNISHNPIAGVESFAYLKDDSYNKTSFTTSVDFKTDFDSAGISSWVKMVTNTAYSGMLPNILFTFGGSSMSITIGGNGVGGINIKPIQTNVWHTAILSYIGQNLTMTIQTKDGQILGKYSIEKMPMPISGHWGLSGGVCDINYHLKGKIHFDNFKIISPL